MSLCDELSKTTTIQILQRRSEPKTQLDLYGAVLLSKSSRSTTMSGIDSCLQAAKLIAAAGEMAPFPFIKGTALCVVAVLEIIQKAADNRSNLRELAESIVNTLVAVRDAVIEHGPTSASHFQGICVEFQTYMTDLLSKLNSEKRSPRRIRRFFRAKKISDDISTYRLRIQATKEDFLIRTTTTTRLILSDVQDQVSTEFGSLTSLVEASERAVTSLIKDNTSEMLTLGITQNENMEKLQMALVQAFRERGIYKGVVRNLVPGDIYIRAPIPCDSWQQNSDFDEYDATIDDRPKIVRVYRVPADQKEQVIQQFQKEVDQRLHLRHPNITQLFGVCMVPMFPALVFHGNANERKRYNYKDIMERRPMLGTMEALLFYVGMYNDLQSIANYLAGQDWVRRQEDKDPQRMPISYNCFNEQGRVILDDLTLNDHFYKSFVLHLGCSRVSVVMCTREGTKGSDDLDLPHLEHVFSCPTSLQKDYLWQIYESIHLLFGRNTWRCFDYPESCPGYPGFVSYGRVVGDLEEWTLEWTRDSERSNSRHLNKTTSIHWSLSPNQIYSFSVFPSDRKNYQRLAFSWFAQTLLKEQGPYPISDLREDVTFYLHIQPNINSLPKHDLDTLSVSVIFNAPAITSRSPSEMSWPFSFVANGTPIPPEEAEQILSARIDMSAQLVSYKIQAIEGAPARVRELAAMCGFDPVLEGADICHYFGLFPFEIFDETGGGVTDVVRARSIEREGGGDLINKTSAAVVTE
ncbi:uncharacterized protein EV420DRAFT_730027 [Desarmillaria tabescens]|uniref:Protein kinase domain-containing protein n=1 Tax=Armillaria tabescens TaxID=1929756 RepID=A0AA39JYN9_ARMTA|nr:uncharacterized protein EV420DRAFT_730027 [Desarmillaria tabescens]KAK0451259.1 hypothetical protein EV420DRAFT_730027 [Desarmillaria tabescens]